MLKSKDSRLLYPGDCAFDKRKLSRERKYYNKFEIYFSSYSLTSKLSSAVNSILLSRSLLAQNNNVSAFWPTCSLSIFTPLTLTLMDSEKSTSSGLRSKVNLETPLATTSISFYSRVTSISPGVFDNSSILTHEFRLNLSTRSVTHMRLPGNAFLGLSCLKFSIESISSGNQLVLCSPSGITLQT